MFISKISIVPIGCIIVAVIIAVSRLYEKEGNFNTAYTPENMGKLSSKQMFIHNRALAMMLILFSVINIVPVFFFGNAVKVIFSLAVFALGFLAGAILSRIIRNNYVE